MLHNNIQGDELENHPHSCVDNDGHIEDTDIYEKQKRGLPAGCILAGMQALVCTRGAVQSLGAQSRCDYGWEIHQEWIRDTADQ